VTASRLDVDDPTFAEDLLYSHGVVLLVARFLGARGHSVHIPGLRIRPDVSHLSDYADGGDLFVCQRVEVKQRRFDFSGRGNYPYQTVTVDVAHAWDRANPKPAAYYIVNHDGTHAAIVRASTASKWVKVSKTDRQKNRVRQFYECPLELVSFVELDR
jgi:hypothetical protein